MAKRILPQNAAVLYLRMSDQRQERSIGDQRTELLAYAEKHGYKVLREYDDPAISGDDTIRRSGFLRMREDAEKGEFAVVLCWDQDRFGRFDPIEGGYWILPFRNAGVRLETIAQGKIDWTDFAGRMLYMIQQEGKHSYLRDLSRNSIRGQLAKAREGKGSGGPPPYGYRIENGELVVYPDEAAIVRWAFAEYLKPGSSLRSVVTGLNAKGIPSATGLKWQVACLDRILKNRKHSGCFVWGALTTGRYHGIVNGEIIPRKKTEGEQRSEPIVFPDKHEPIVDPETFRRVQLKLAERKRDTSPLRGENSYLLSGLLRCKNCGASMAGRTVKTREGQVRRYSCCGYLFHGKSVCTFNRIDEAPLVEIVVRLIEREYFGDRAIDRLRKALQRRRKVRTQVAPADLKRVRKQIEVLDGQIEAGAERVFSAPAGIVSSLYTRLDSLRIERDRLQSELQAAEHPKDGSNDQEVQEVDEALDALKTLRKAFAEAETADLRVLLRSIVSRIELRFTSRPKGKLTISDFEDGTAYLRPDTRLTNLLPTG
jgi:DNA invertase Pin-like site-specific DNA recombinase